MSLLFDVYKHPARGLWGFSLDGNRIDIVEVTPKTTKQTTLPAHSLAGEVSKRLRTGYVKCTKPMYFKPSASADGDKNNGFVDKHPELTPAGGVAMFTKVGIADNFAELAELWETQLDPTTIASDAMEEWLEQVRTAREYVATGLAHPAPTLVLAQWALENGRVLVAETEGMPLSKPSEAPLEWKQWLNTVFKDAKCVHETIDQLGWSANALLASEIAESTTTNGDAGWLAGTASFAF